MTIAENIKAIISEAGYKQKAIAKKAGWNEKQFNALLNGRKTFKAEYLPAICLALDKSPNEIMSYGEKIGERKWKNKV